MPFDMSNAPSIFMRMMIHVLRPFIGKFLVVYSKEDHIDYLCQVFETLRSEKLYINLQKCSFLQSQVLFLGYLVSAQGIFANSVKVHAIKDWLEPNFD